MDPPSIRAANIALVTTPRCCHATQLWGARTDELAAGPRPNPRSPTAAKAHGVGSPSATTPASAVAPAKAIANAVICTGRIPCDTSIRTLKADPKAQPASSGTSVAPAASASPRPCAVIQSGTYAAQA